MDRRTVFFVSDQTGVTAETMGHSLLTQFDGQAFRQVTLPFISTVDKAEEAVRRINATGEAEGVRPVIFSTLVQEDMREIIKRANGLFLDFFDAFLGPLEHGAEGEILARAGQGARHAGHRRVHAAHQRDQLRAGQRRRRGHARLRARGPDPGRRVALRQDADVPVHGLAIRHFRREFPVRRRGVRDRRAAGVAGEASSASCTD